MNIDEKGHLNIPDPRPVYLSPAARVEQAKRLIPILEAEIAGGETRSVFFELLEMHRSYLTDTTKEIEYDTKETG